MMNVMNEIATAVGWLTIGAAGFFACRLFIRAIWRRFLDQVVEAQRRVSRRNIAKAKATLKSEGRV